MRTITLDRCAQIVQDMFERYVEPFGLSLMYGEIPKVILNIHRRGSKEHDFLASVSIRNSVTVSVLQCTVYIEDIFNLTRKAKLYLVTEPIFNVACLYAMLHPIFQRIFVEECKDMDVNTDYECMMVAAGMNACDFIGKTRGYWSYEETLALGMLRYAMMEYMNLWRLGPKHRGKDHYPQYVLAKKRYLKYITKTYPEGWASARYRPAQHYLCDTDGFMLMERLTESDTKKRREEAKHRQEKEIEEIAIAKVDLDDYLRQAVEAREKLKGGLSYEQKAPNESRRKGNTPKRKGTKIPY